MAAASCGPKGQLALLVDEVSQQRFLVDTGSSYSILPHKSQRPRSGPRLCSADRSPIACWGGRKVHMEAGERTFSWTFLLADVALPIIGADFLKHFGLLVDLGEMRLLARGGGWSHHLVEPSRSGLFATLGVLVAQKKKKRRRCEVLPLPSGQAVAASVARDGSPEASTIAVVTSGPVLDVVEPARARDACQETQQLRAKQDVLISGNRRPSRRTGRRGGDRWVSRRHPTCTCARERSSDRWTPRTAAHTACWSGRGRSYSWR